MEDGYGLPAIAKKLEGKVALITGGASGIGECTARLFVLGTKHAARAMIPARRGSIIATSSLAGCIGGAASHAYTCAKHGVVGLTKNAASELGRYGIRVNCVSPSALATPLAKGYLNMNDEQVEGLMGSIANLKGVALRMEDVANAVLFLASDDSKYMSGHNMVIDGGHSIHNPVFKPFEVADS